jgi:hypothetical protein
LDCIEGESSPTSSRNSVQTLLAAGTTGKRTAFVTEQFAFEQGLRQSAAVHRHIGTVGAHTVLMHEMRRQFLSGSRLPAQENVGMRFGGLRQLLHRVQEGRRAPDKPHRVTTEFLGNRHPDYRLAEEVAPVGLRNQVAANLHVLGLPPGILVGVQQLAGTPMPENLDMGALLAALPTRRFPMVRYLITPTPHDLTGADAVQRLVRRIGGDHRILFVDENKRIFVCVNQRLKRVRDRGSHFGPQQYELMGQ